MCIYIYNVYTYILCIHIYIYIYICICIYIYTRIHEIYSSICSQCTCHDNLDLLMWQVSYIPLGVDTNEFRIAALDTGTVRHGLEKTTYAVRVKDGRLRNVRKVVHPRATLKLPSWGLASIPIRWSWGWFMMALGFPTSEQKTVPEGVQGVLGLAAEEWLQDPKSWRCERSQDLWASDRKRFHDSHGWWKMAPHGQLFRDLWIYDFYPPVWTEPDWWWCTSLVIQLALLLGRRRFDG